MTSFHPPPLPGMKLKRPGRLIRVRLESEIICPDVTFKVLYKKLGVISVHYSLLPTGLWVMKQRVKRWVACGFFSGVLLIPV